MVQPRPPSLKIITGNGLSDFPNRSLMFAANHRLTQLFHVFNGRRVLLLQKPVQIVDQGTLPGKV